MSGEPPDFYTWIQDLTVRSVADQTRVLQRYNDLVQRVMRGELNDPQLREEYAHFAREESTRYASDLTRLSLSYYNALLELGRNYSDRFFDQLLRSRGPQAGAGNGGEPAVQRRQVSLELQGELGQEAAAAFVIENKRDTPAEISFQVSEFVDAAGGSSFRAPLQIQPAQLSLGPQAEAAVMLRLPLWRELFDAGHRYHATVVVRGYDELELILSVRVSPAEQNAPAASPPGAGQAVAAEAEIPARPKRSRRPAGSGKTSPKKKPVGSRPRRRGPGTPGG